MKAYIFVLLFLCCAKTFAQSFVPDSAINRIVLEDSESVLNVLGKDCWNALFEDFDNYKVIANNKTKTEKLELVFYEGGNRYKFAEFRISLVKDNRVPIKYKCLFLNEDYFESSKGIRLGLSPESVESKLGLRLERKQGKTGETILSFRKEVDKNPVFKRYNMQVYHGKYIFRNDKLVEFSFGFEEP